MYNLSGKEFSDEEIEKHIDSVRNGDEIPFNEDAKLYLASQVTIFHDNVEKEELERLYDMSGDPFIRIVSGLALGYTWKNIEENESKHTFGFNNIESLIEDLNGSDYEIDLSQFLYR